MQKSTSKWWIGGAIVIVLIVLITWVGTWEESAQPIVGTSVVVRSPPATARAGAPTSLAWEVRSSVGATATHTAIHWGPTSTSGELGIEVAPGAAGYPNLLPDYQQGSFALPRTFSGALIFPSAGTVYYRAHAIIDGKHYWSPEHSLVVQ